VSNAKDATAVAGLRTPTAAHIAHMTGDPVFERHLRAITVLLAGHQLRRINKMYEAFRGDLLLAIALGEIGVQYLREAITDAATAPDQARALRTYRRPQLTRTSGIPRETVRRAVRRLVEAGWLQEPAPRTVALTERAFEFFGSQYNRTMLDDLLWTGDRIRDLLQSRDDPAARRRLRDELIAAAATRKEDHVGPIFSTQFVPPSSGDLGRQPLAVALTLAEYWLSHLYRLQSAFDGDLVAALLLGEVAHYNVASLAYQRDVGLATLDAMFVDGAEAEVMAILRPCNAHSLSLVTRVPDSTVRRKLAALVARGWLAEVPSGYVVTDAPKNHFRDFNETSLRAMLDTDRRLRQQLGARPG
jgi:DNA-binding GntR family transcriptional regulator